LFFLKKQDKFSQKKRSWDDRAGGRFIGLTCLALESNRTLYPPLQKNTALPMDEWAKNRHATA
jgi:hypothetical protein